jgi:hypothetical protein
MVGVVARLMHAGAYSICRVHKLTHPSLGGLIATIHEKLPIIDKYSPLDCIDSNIQCPLIRSNMLSTHRDTI